MWGFQWCLSITFLLRMDVFWRINFISWMHFVIWWKIQFSDHKEHSKWHSCSENVPNEAETGEEEDVIVSHCGASPGTGSFGILYRFLINVIEWGVPEHSLITFSTLILRRRQKIDLSEGSWEARGTKVHAGEPRNVLTSAVFWEFLCLLICCKTL